MSTPPDPDLAPIFVIGTGRSGTTLLRLMLNAHPRIYLTHEAAFYVAAHALPRGRSGAAFLDMYLRGFPFAWLRMDPAIVRREVGDALPRERLPEAFRAIMRCKAREHGRVRYGDKTPFHSAHLAAIFRDFPDARVVHIVRDPRATVASLMRMPWAPGSVGLVNMYCKIEARQVAPFLDRIHDVRLEDLLAKPRETMAGVLSFVGEAWDDAVLDHARHAPANDVPPFPWLLPAAGERRAEGARSAADEGWRTQLSPAWIRIVERDNRGAMERYGYARATLAREPGFFGQAGAIARDLPRTIAATLRLMSTLGKLGPDSRLPVGEVQARLLQLNPGAWRHYPGFVAPEPPG